MQTVQTLSLSPYFLKPMISLPFKGPITFNMITPFIVYETCVTTAWFRHESKLLIGVCLVMF